MKKVLLRKRHLTFYNFKKLLFTSNIKQVLGTRKLQLMWNVLVKIRLAVPYESIDLMHMTSTWSQACIIPTFTNSRQLICLLVGDTCLSLLRTCKVYVAHAGCFPVLPPKWCSMVQCIRTIPSNKLFKPMTVEEMISSYSTGKKKKKRKKIELFFMLLSLHTYLEKLKPQIMKAFGSKAKQAAKFSLLGKEKQSPFLSKSCWLSPIAGEPWSYSKKELWTSSAQNVS